MGAIRRSEMAGRQLAALLVELAVLTGDAWADGCRGEGPLEWEEALAWAPRRQLLSRALRSIAQQGGC